jgi:redox-sensitive bicupin YhaK (pirin superfamily)
MNRVLKGQRKDLDGFSVTRFLPSAQQRMVGPFIFIDHMGPAQFAAGEGINVRPHPHIGLSTITYLMQGSLLHRDSLGNQLEILPGEVNWMTAGRGIVHSERETLEVKANEHSLNGLQCWVALPKELAEIEPSFTHIKREQLPHQMGKGTIVRLLAGEAFGMASPLKTYSPMFYLDVLLPAGKSVARPNPGQECLAYVLDGEVVIDTVSYSPGAAVIIHDSAEISANTHARLILLGGDAWPEVPHIYWNFVAFDLARIEQAKNDWREQRFPKIPGDNQEYTPLP